MSGGEMDGFRVRERQSAIDWLNQHRDEVVALSDEIWGYAEPAMREYRSAAAHVRVLRDHGFTVEEGISGMPTAFLATYGSGAPVIGMYAEYDATPGNSQQAISRPEPVVPHAAGFEDLHNGLGTASTYAAIAARYTMERFGLSGTIKLFGTPAEKLCVGKVYPARDGYFDDLDAVVAWHPWTHNTVDWHDGPGCYEAVVFSFFGVASYGGHPWDGASALDAVYLMQSNVHVAKEHVVSRDVMPSINEIVTVGGQCPTNLPEFAQIWYVFRALDRASIERILAKLLVCAEAAANVTDCRWEHRIVAATRPFLPNHTMARLVFRNLELVGPPRFSEADKAFARELQAALGLEPMAQPFDETLTEPWDRAGDFAGGADDYTEFAWHAPAAWLHIAYNFIVPGQAHFHVPSWATAALAKTHVGHESVLIGAKTMAASVVDLMISPDEVAAAKAEYQQRIAEHWEPVPIPAGAVPPDDLTFPPYYPRGWQPPTGIA